MAFETPDILLHTLTLGSYKGTGMVCACTGQLDSGCKTGFVRKQTMHSTDEKANVPLSL